MFNKKNNLVETKKVKNRDANSMVARNSRRGLQAVSPIELTYDMFGGVRCNLDYSLLIN